MLLESSGELAHIEDVSHREILSAFITNVYMNYVPDKCPAKT